MDGKALRGTRHHTLTGRARHLLSIIDAGRRLMLGQCEVDGKSNEVTSFQPLLKPLDLHEVVVTADALHTQREHARFLVEEKKTHYVLIVKKNQRALYHQLKHLPWRQVQLQHTTDDAGHGRQEQRSIKVVSLAEGLLFPHSHLRRKA